MQGRNGREEEEEEDKEDEEEERTTSSYCALNDHFIHVWSLDSLSLGN